MQDLLFHFLLDLLHFDQKLILAQSFLSKPNSEAVMSIAITARFFYIININLDTILELKRKLVLQEKKEIERLLCYEMLNSLLSRTLSLRTGSQSRCSRSCPWVQAEAQRQSFTGLCTYFYYIPESRFHHPWSRFYHRQRFTLKLCKACHNSM